MAAKRYYVRIRGKVLGPFDEAQLRRQRDRGQLSRFHELSEDRVHWLPAAELAELFAPEEAPAGAGPPEATMITPAHGRGGAAAAAGAPPPEVWHYMNARGKQLGPVTRQQLLDLLDEGAVGPQTLVWNAALSDWVPLESAPGLGGAAPPPPSRGGRTSPLALASLIAAVAWVGGLGSAAGVVLGLLALREISRRKGALRGRGLALAGVMAGGAGLALALVVGAGALLYFATRGEETHSRETIASEYRERVYQINAGDSLGSGILLANTPSRGLIATNLHVIDHQMEEDKVLRKLAGDHIPKSLTVEVQNPTQLTARKANLAAFHREYDLALLVLEMDNALPSAVPVLRQKNLREAESAVAIGYPLGKQLSVTDGIISNPRGEGGKVFTTCTISSGNSGGPLFVQRGGLLAGLNTMTFTGGDIDLVKVGTGKIVARPQAVAQNFNGAVPAEQIIVTLQQGRTDNWVWAPEHRDLVVELAKMVPLKD